MQPPQSLPSYQHDDWISSVSINSKKNLILTGSYDKVARIWDLSGNCISNLLGHTAPVKTVSWVEKNGTYCITGSNDNTVRIWEFDETTGNSTPKYECKGHEGTIEDIAVSKSNDYFATASYDSNIKIWGMNSSLDKEEEEENDEDVESKQKKRKISSDIKIKNSMATLKGHNNGVTCIVFDKNTYTLYSGGNDHSLRFWNIEARSNTFTMNCEKVINCIDFSDHNNLLATGHSDKFIRIWDSRIKEGSSVKLRLSSHNKWVSSLKWSPKSPYMLVSGSYDSSVKFWDIRSSTSPLYTIKGGNELDDKVLCVDWVNDLVATGGSDTILRLHSTSGIDLTNTQ
jgi:ribosome biogenesis protein YTM1